MIIPPRTHPDFKGYAVPPLLKAEAAAAYLDISVDTLARWRVQGSGPAFVKFTRAKQGIVRYRREDLDAFIAEHRCTSTSPATVQPDPERR